MVAKLNVVHIHASPSQVRKLQKGLSIRLRPNCLDGDCHLMVSKVLFNRIQKRRAQGKGIQIKLCPRGIEGSGFFSTLVKFGKKVAKAVFKAGKHAIKHRGQIVGAVKTGIAIANLIKKLTGAGFSAKQIHQMQMKGILETAERLGKEIFKKVREPKKLVEVVKKLTGGGFSDDDLRGMGFFSEVLRRLNNVQKVITGVDIAKVIKSLKGKGFFLPLFGAIKAITGIGQIINALRGKGVSDDEIEGMGLFDMLGKNILAKIRGLVKGAKKFGKRAVNVGKFAFERRGQFKKAVQKIKRGVETDIGVGRDLVEAGRDISRENFLDVIDKGVDTVDTGFAGAEKIAQGGQELSKLISQLAKKAKGGSTHGGRRIHLPVPIFPTLPFGVRGGEAANGLTGTDRARRRRGSIASQILRASTNGNRMANPNKRDPFSGNTIGNGLFVPGVGKGLHVPNGDGLVPPDGGRIKPLFPPA